MLAPVGFPVRLDAPSLVPLLGHSTGRVRVDLGLPVPDPRGFPTRGHGYGYTAGTGIVPRVRVALRGLRVHPRVVMWRAGLEALKPWKPGPHKPEPLPALLRA